MEQWKVRKTFLNNIRNQSGRVQIREWLSKIEILFDNFDAVQIEIEILDHSEIETSEKASLENKLLH